MSELYFRPDFFFVSGQSAHVIVKQKSNSEHILGERSIPSITFKLWIALFRAPNIGTALTFSFSSRRKSLCLANLAALLLNLDSIHKIKHYLPQPSLRFSVFMVSLSIALVPFG